MIEPLFDFKEVEKNIEKTKCCTKCKTELPLSAYGKANGASYGRGECKECNRKIMASRKLARASAPPVPENHLCPICLRPESEVRGRGGKKSGTWCCDHDHVTGLFRGWLCHDCNRGIGALADSPERINRVLSYLKK
jgi:hypothetical protein